MHLLKVLLRSASPGPPFWAWFLIDSVIYLVGGMVITQFLFSLPLNEDLGILLILVFFFGYPLISGMSSLRLPPWDQMRMAPATVTAGITLYLLVTRYDFFTSLDFKPLASVAMFLSYLFLSFFYLFFAVGVPILRLGHEYEGGWRKPAWFGAKYKVVGLEEDEDGNVLKKGELVLSPE